MVFRARHSDGSVRVVHNVEKVVHDPHHRYYNVYPFGRPNTPHVYPVEEIRTFALVTEEEYRRMSVEDRAPGSHDSFEHPF